MTTLRYVPCTTNVKLEVARHQIMKQIEMVEECLQTESSKLGRGLYESQLQGLNRVIEIMDIIGEAEIPR